MKNQFPPPAGFEHYGEDLIKRFPYLFKDCIHGVSVPIGWAGLFTKLCEDVDALLGDNKRGFHWAQVTEKFGVLSVSFAVRKLPELADELYRLAGAATAQSRSLCAVCGQPGSLTSEGYMMTLCDHHKEQRKKLPDFWIFVHPGVWSFERNEARSK
jgi:hypothetical protein